MEVGYYKKVDAMTLYGKTGQLLVFDEVTDEWLAISELTVSPDVTERSILPHKYAGEDCLNNDQVLAVMSRSSFWLS